VNRISDCRIVAPMQLAVNPDPDRMMSQTVVIWQATSEEEHYLLVLMAAPARRARMMY